MSILFVGALAPEFINGRLVTTPSAAFDAAYAPGAQCILNGDIATRAVGTLLATASTDVWLHTEIYMTERPIYNGDQDFLGLYTAAGVRLCALSGSYAGGGAKLWLKVLAGTSGYANTDIYALLPVGVRFTLDLHYKLNAGVATCSMFINGLLAVSISAATSVTDGAATVRFGNQLTTSPIYYSEIIVTGGGESTIGWRLSSMAALANGALSEWTGNFADLGDADTATGVWTDQVNKRITGTFAAYAGAANPMGVRALVQVGRFVENASGLTLQGILYDTAPRETFTQNYKDTSRIITVWDNNPVTAAPWQTSAFTGFQGGFKSLAA